MVYLRSAIYHVKSYSHLFSPSLIKSAITFLASHINELHYSFDFNSFEISYC